MAIETMTPKTAEKMTPIGWLRSTLLACSVSLLVLEQVNAFPRVQTTDTTFLTSATSSSSRIVGASRWSLSGQPRQKRPFSRDISLVTVPRGGTSNSSILEDGEQVEDGEEEEEEANEVVVVEEDDEDEEEEDDKSENEDEDQPAVDTSQGRVLVKVQTNLENVVVDHHVEMMLRRDKNVTFVKNRVKRDVPGKIPLLAIELLLDGRPLSDETVLDDICKKLEEGIEDEDDDEDDIDRDEEGNPVLTLTLNIVPPVDKKFAAALTPKLEDHYEGDDEKTLPTDTLLDAYFLNQVAMERNAQLLADPNKVLPPTNPVEMKNQARMLKEQLKSQTDPEVWEKSLQPIKKADNLPEIRGQRYRSGKGGAATSLKKNIQTFFNVVSVMDLDRCWCQCSKNLMSFFIPHSKFLASGVLSLVLFIDSFTTRNAIHQNRTLLYRTLSMQFLPL